MAAMSDSIIQTQNPGEENYCLDETMASPSPSSFNFLAAAPKGTDLSSGDGSVVQPFVPQLSSTTKTLEKENTRRQNGGVDVTPGATEIVHTKDPKFRGDKQDESCEKYRTCHQTYKDSIQNYYTDDDESFASSSEEQAGIENRGEEEESSNNLSRQQRIPQPPSQPGAYPLGMGRNNVDSAFFSEDGTGSIFYDQSAPSSQSRRRETNNEGLVEANPVTDSQVFPEDRNMEVAEPVLDATTTAGISSGTIPHQHPGGGYGEKSFSLQMGLCGLAILLLVLVGLIIALVGKKSSTGESQLHKATNTSASIQSIPTELHLLAILPASTQAVIRKDESNSSPQSQAYQWLLDDPGFDGYDTARLRQRYAMATLYYSLDGPNWSNQGGGGNIVTIVNPKGKGRPSAPAFNVSAEKWLDYNSHECRWFGTSQTQTRDTFCPTDNDTITTMVLWQNNLRGSLPQEVGLLTSLTKLHLHHNQIGGSIVSQLGQLTSLTRIYLMSNRFTGIVPWTELAHLPKLERLGLIGNKLEGSSFPFWKNYSMPSLLDYKVGRNNFVGGSIPEDLSIHLPNVNKIFVDRIRLRGNVGPLARCSHLEQIGADGNQLTGSIPRDFERLSNLTFLSLFDNLLTGVIPSELGLLSNLEKVWLQGNSGLVGSLPTELVSLNQTLQDLDITGTGITGKVPSPLCTIPSLKFDCSSGLCGCNCEC